MELFLIVFDCTFIDSSIITKTFKQYLQGLTCHQQSSPVTCIAVEGSKRHYLSV